MGMQEDDIADLNELASMMHKFVSDIFWKIYLYITKDLLKGNFFFFFFFMYVIQYCSVCRLSDSTVSEDAGIEPGLWRL
jgi:hypothetical protein